MIHSLVDQAGGAPTPPAGKFSLGQIVATNGAIAELSAEEIQTALFRHHHGDWGDVCEFDRQENERSLLKNLRLLSVYSTERGVKFYIITEHDRSVTTVLLPSEY